MRPIVLFSGVSILVVAIDQLLKYTLKAWNGSLSLGFLTIHLSQNTGAGFGILQGYTWLLALISLIVAGAVIIGYKKISPHPLEQVLWALFLGGVIGNMLDRFVRGYVIDFIDFGFWPSFNVADAVITVSVAGLIFFYWREEKKK